MLSESCAGRRGAAPWLVLRTWELMGRVYDALEDFDQLCTKPVEVCR